MSKSSISTFELFQRFPDAESARLYFERAGPSCPMPGKIPLLTLGLAGPLGWLHKMGRIDRDVTLGQSI